MTHNEQDVERKNWRRCPHVNLRGIYGDEINATPRGYRLQCRDCGRLLDGPVSLARAALDAMAPSVGGVTREDIIRELEGAAKGDWDIDYTADAILALFPAPQTVGSVEELEALDWGTRFLDADGVHWVAVQRGYIASDGGDRVRMSTGIPLPATVLTPATAPTVTACPECASPNCAAEVPGYDDHA